MKRTRTANSALNIAVGIGGYAVNTVLGLICRMVFTRTLSADYLGVNGLFSNILAMLSLAELGIGSAIVYALYKPLATDDQEKIVSLVRFYGKCYRIIGCVVGIVGIMLIPFLKLIIREQPNIHESIYLLYLLFLFNTASTYFFSYRASLLTAAQKNYIVTGLNYLITILQSVIQMVWLLNTHNYIGYLLIQTLGTLLYNIIISKLAVKEFPFLKHSQIKPLEKEEKQRLFKNIRALLVIKLSGTLVNNTDNMIITYFGGLITVGYASNYILLSSTLNSLLNQVFNGVNASVGNFNAVKGDKDKLNLFNEINLANFWLFGWAAIGIFVVSSDIVRLLFGQEYVMDISIPLVIALNFYIMGMQSTVWTFKNTLGLFRPGRYLLILTAMINLLCSIWWGRLWGLFGIYLATAASRLLTNVWYEPYAVFKYGFGEKVWSYYKRYGEYAAILAVTATVCYFICKEIRLTALVNVLLKFLICCIVPNLSFFLCFRKRDEFQYFNNLLLRIVRKVRSK